MRFVVVAGGTGGHFYPGLAVAKELLRRQHVVSFLIRKGDYVRPLLERENIPFHEISGAGFKRRLAPSNLMAVEKNILGIFQATSFLRSDPPAAILAMGGYLSFPPAVAARRLRIPVVLHEQNVVPGLANRLLSRLASRVAVSFDATRSSFPKAMVTGLPVREEFRFLPTPLEARKRLGLDPSIFTLFVFGGSLGAQRLNRLVTDTLAGFAEHASALQVFHVTGPKDEKEVRSAYVKQSIRHVVVPYCHDMAAAYAASDFVLCRAGASTIAELMATRRPAVLIPYPLATAQHQTANAQVLVRLGAAECYEEKELYPERLAEILSRWVGTRPFIAERERAYRALTTDPQEATAKLAELLESTAQATGPASYVLK